MTSHDWYVEHRMGYAIRSLDPEDERTFADHAARCEECRSALAEIDRELGWLAMGVRPAQPPPGFRWRAALAALGPGRRAAWKAWVPIAVAAAALLVAGAVWQRSGARVAGLVNELAAANGQLAAIADSLSVMRQAAKVLQATIEMDGQRGGLLIFADSVSHRWNVVVHGLPPARPGEKYQFWYVCSDGMVRGIELRPHSGRLTMVTVGMPDRGGAVLGASLSVEPEGNMSDEPQGRQLAHLML